MASETPININISKDNGSHDNNEYSEFKDYIIKNNVILQQENKNFIEIITSLKEKIESYEEAEDKHDNRMRYMKGLLQNLNELKKDYTRISSKSEDKVKLIQELHKKNKINYYQIYAFLLIINLLTFITPLYFVNLFIMFLQTTASIIYIYSCFKIKNNYELIKSNSKEATNSVKEITTEINKIKEEIKKAEDACLSLDNWICEV
jgi:DNA repair exonuclease SbcCD ATPase subunit